jgi:transposase InsO family protein
MVTAVEHRFGPLTPVTIETDNGSRYIVHDTKRFARDIGIAPGLRPPLNVGYERLPVCPTGLHATTPPAARRARSVQLRAN